jgi:hypothetical protein
MASTPSWLFVACVALAISATPACGLDTFGASAGPGTTASSSLTTAGTGNTAQATTGDASTAGIDPTTTSVDPSTTSVDPATTTGVASATTTGVASSTTIEDDMPGMTTTNGTTGEPPPSKDPQPLAGLYEACLDNTPCDISTDGCFTLTDANMNVTAGYCTVICDSVVDCGTKPKCPAVQECLSVSVDQKVCALKCAVANDCPTGMDCINITLPMGQAGTYCF